MIKCKECGKEINTKAEICPHCGCRVKSNTPKIIIICIIVIGVICGLLFMYFELPRLVKTNRDNNIMEKYYGKYELVNGNIKDISQIREDLSEQKQFIIIDKDNLKINEQFGTNLATQEKFELAKNNNQEFIFGGVHMFATYSDGHTDLDIQLCFSLNNNYLEQINCPIETNEEYSLFKTDNINLKYKKID